KSIRGGDALVENGDRAVRAVSQAEVPCAREERRRLVRGVQACLPVCPPQKTGQPPDFAASLTIVRRHREQLADTGLGEKTVHGRRVIDVDSVLLPKRPRRFELRKRVVESPGGKIALPKGQISRRRQHDVSTPFACDDASLTEANRVVDLPGETVGAAERELDGLSDHQRTRPLE